MTVDLLAVLFVVGLVSVSALGVCGLTVWQGRGFEDFRRRCEDPQLVAATGTGVERGALRDADADLTVLPRSPLVPADGAPRPPSAGPVLPVAAVAAAAVTGFQPRRVRVDG